MFPADLKYTAEHEWIKDPGRKPIQSESGSPSYAQEALGDIVSVDLPAVNDEIESGAVVGELESTKSVSEVYSPFAGTIVSVNEALSESPDWLVNLTPTARAGCLRSPTGSSVELFDSAAYEALTQS
ncbi:MAG: glycine cleavage system protein H [Marmoricola sp.]